MDVNYKTHEEFLRGITTFVNMETDLHLYRLDRAFSNHQMSMVGIQILSPSLQAAYGDKKYLIRCYHDEKKFFEMALGNLFIEILCYV